MVHRLLHGLVLDAVGSDTLSLSVLKQRIDTNAPTILPDRKAVLSRLERWCRQLVEQGEIQVGRDGRVTRVKPEPARGACVGE